MPLRRNVLGPLAVDLVLALLAWWSAFWLRFNLEIPDEFERLALKASLWCIAAYAIGLTLARVYRHGRVLEHETRDGRISIVAEVPRRLAGLLERPARRREGLERRDGLDGS